MRSWRNGVKNRQAWATQNLVTPLLHDLSFFRLHIIDLPICLPPAVVVFAVAVAFALYIHTQALQESTTLFRLNGTPGVALTHQSAPSFLHRPPLRRSPVMKKSTQNRVVPAIPLPLAKKAQRQAIRQTSSPTTPAYSSGASAKGKSEDGEPKTAVPASAEPGPVSTQVIAGEESKDGGYHGRRSVETPVSFDGALPTSLSNGTTPDRLPNDVHSHFPPVTNGMVNNFTPPASSASGNGTPRKMSDMFEMRHIRTELPPAFVPSADRSEYTPQSTTSSGSHRQPPILPHAHPNHPSVGQIVFGGMESGNSSPAPPPNASSAFAPPQYPAQVPAYGHAHHASEPHPPRMHQPAFHQQSVPWGLRQGFAHAHQPHGPTTHRYVPRDAPRHSHASLTNGNGSRSRSDSQSSAFAPDVPRDFQFAGGHDHSIDSAKAMFSEQKAAFPPLLPRHMPTHTPNPSQHFPHHPDVAATFENAEAMRGQILSQFDNSDLADCNLQVSEEDGANGQRYNGHKIILARSSRLLGFIRDSAPAPTASDKTELHVVLPGRYVRASAFADALRYIYGGPLPPFEQYNLGPNPSPEERIELALQHIGTGWWLKMPGFAHRGVEIATSLLHWNTIPQVLEFALAGGLTSQAWPLDDGSEERTSTCSSDDSLTKPEHGGQPTYDPFATGLLTRTLDYMAHHFPSNFYLDSSAPQSTACPRLPAQGPRHETRPSRSDPRLSKIRFGEHPVEDHSRPSFATTMVSSILLSLPFPLLKWLLEHPLLPSRLGVETVASIMRQVVHEREVRRQRALKARAASQDVEDAEPHLIHNLYWEESVEQSSQVTSRAGFRLTRRRRGIDTPPTTSGVDSEQSK